MSTSRVSLAELLANPALLSPEEKAYVDSATDEELHHNASADPDAQPWTDDMFRTAQAGRTRRLTTAGAAAESGSFDVTLSLAPGLQDLPLWAVKDESGDIVYLRAANIEAVTPASDVTAFKIVKLDARSRSKNEHAIHRDERRR